jgi:hypothetical protein
LVSVVPPQFPVGAGDVSVGVGVGVVVGVVGVVVGVGVAVHIPSSCCNALQVVAADACGAVPATVSTVTMVADITAAMPAAASSRRLMMRGIGDAAVSDERSCG